MLKNNIDNSDDSNICPICHENINLNQRDSYLTFECCNQMSHFDCIVLWVNSNFKKSIKSNNKYTCIMCQQNNDIIRDIAENINIKNNTNNNVENNSENSTAESSNYSSMESENIIESINYNTVEEVNRQTLYNRLVNKEKNLCKLAAGIITIVVLIPIIIIIL